MAKAEEKLAQLSKKAGDTQLYEREIRAKLRSSRDKCEEARQLYTRIEREHSEHRLRLSSLEENALNLGQEKAENARKLEAVSSAQEKLPDITSIEE